MKSSAQPANRGTPGRLGRYEVIGRLATGGMAEIFLGRVLGPHGFERPVAIKRILPHLAADRTFLDMFIAEAKIAAAIHHARVAQVHELADCDDGYLLVMEYVEGESLGGLMRRTWLRGESLDRALAAFIVAEACSGLHAAHELADDRGVGLGVVHRDVSPQNVMVTYAGEVKVLDFGIAKAHNSDNTKTGQVKGKCEYMSPEQCRGEALDRQSDLFSLGIVLYELTVKKRLFKRDNPLLAFDAICHAPIPRPTEVDPVYPAALEPICARALARDRSERYATALEMRRDLVAAIRGMTGVEGGAGEEERLAALMARLFADRIEEKRVMLRQAPPAAAIARLPAAEVDVHVDLPPVPRETRVVLRVEPVPRAMHVEEAPPAIHVEEAPPAMRVEELPPAMQARHVSRTRLFFVAGAAAALVIGGGVWLAGRAPSPLSPYLPRPGASHATLALERAHPPIAMPIAAPANPDVNAALAQPIAAPANAEANAALAQPVAGPAHPDAPAAIAHPTAAPSNPQAAAGVAQPATVSLVVESVPPGAEVSIAGAARGRTPCAIEVARAEQALTVAVLRGGFQPVTERLVPDTDQKLVLHLRPVAASSHPTKPRPARAHPPQPPKEAPVFERFD